MRLNYHKIFLIISGIKRGGVTLPFSARLDFFFFLKRILLLCCVWFCAGVMFPPGVVEWGFPEGFFLCFFEESVEGGFGDPCFIVALDLVGFG